MLTVSDIRTLEKRYGFRPHRRYGQNFLVDGNVCRKILNAAAPSPRLTFLEIGAGLGQLTVPLAQRARRVIAVEYDKKIASLLARRLRGRRNVLLVQDDFLKYDLCAHMIEGRPNRVLANLPYSISTPALLKVFAHHRYFDEALIMVQREVGRRLLASPGTKEYGSLSLFTDFHAEGRLLFPVSRRCFYPAPRVESVVVHLIMRTTPPVTVTRNEDLFELIRAAFSERRKTIVNAIASRGYKNIDRDTLAALSKEAGVNPRDRAEAIDLTSYAALTDTIERYLSRNRHNRIRPQ